MPKFELLYTMPDSTTLRKQVIFAVHARHAAQKAEAIERATGVRVLSVKEVKSCE